MGHPILPLLLHHCRLLYNFYTFLNDENEYYTEQWQWLEKELRRARDNGEKVKLVQDDVRAPIKCTNYSMAGAS